jgi:hypothetical protein
MKLEFREHVGHSSLLMDIKDADQLKLTVYGSDEENCLVQAKLTLEQRVEQGKEAEKLLIFVNEKYEKLKDTTVAR